MEIQNYRKGNLIEVWGDYMADIKISSGMDRIVEIKDDSINQINLQFIKPALISEHRLCQLGFVKFEDRWTNYKVDLKCIGPNIWDVFYSGETLKYPISHIHELQNIHLYLTKQEISLDDDYYL